MSEPAEHAPEVDATESYVAKWLTHEPEMDIALVFTGADRPRARLWGALLNEWLEAAFELSDSGVAQAKLGWWGEALAQASADSAHPLVRAFALEVGDAVAPALWRDVAHAVGELSTLDTTPVDVGALLESRMPVAKSLSVIEARLWPRAGDVDAQALARHLVLRQWRRHQNDRIAQPGWLPLQLLARHGLRLQEAYTQSDAAPTQALRVDLANALAAVSLQRGGSRFRRIRTRLDDLALARLGGGGKQSFPRGGFAVLWQSWRAARGAVT